MNEMVFVETSGPGLQALEFAAKAGYRRTLLRSPRYAFLLTDEQDARARSLADRTVAVDDVHDTAAVLAALRAAGLEPEAVDAVVSTAHLGAVAAARLAEAVKAPGTAPAAIARTKDKALCRRILDEQGIPNLGFGVAGSLDDTLAAARRIGFPVVVKPVHGVGKVHTAIAYDAGDVRRHFAGIEEAAQASPAGLAAELDGRFIVEELAVGPLFSVEVAADGASFVPLVTVRRKTGRDNPVLELGSTVPSGLSAEHERTMGDYAVRVCRALGLRLGLFHVEIIRTAAGPRLVEVNPRIAGGAIPDLVTAATGRNLFEVLIDLVTGRPAPAEPFPHLAGASHSFIAAARDCTVRADLPADWFEPFRPRIHSGHSSITPGARLRRMDGNLDLYGVLRVIADDPRAAERACAALIAEVEATVGVPLAPVAGADQT